MSGEGGWWGEWESSGVGGVGIGCLVKYEG